MLVDFEVNGRTIKAILWANRNGFFYVLDRETGRFLLGKEFATQTWAQGLDDNGHPIRVPDMEPSPEGRLVFPDVTGASNWWSPSYSPMTGLFYTMAYDGAATYFTADTEYEAGKLFVGGSYTRDVPADTYVSAVRAINPLTGDRVWEHRVPPKSMSGVMATAGQLVFTGTVTGNFIAPRRDHRRGPVAHVARRKHHRCADHLPRERNAARVDSGRSRDLYVRAGVGLGW